MSGSVKAVEQPIAVILEPLRISIRRVAIMNGCFLPSPRLLGATAQTIRPGLIGCKPRPNKGFTCRTDRVEEFPWPREGSPRPDASPFRGCGIRECCALLPSAVQ